VVLALAGALDGRVYLENSPLAERLRPLLVEELGAEALATSAEDARFSLKLVELDGALSLSLSSTTGALILDRTIAAGGDQKPALRAATLAIEEAIAAELSLASAALPVPLDSSPPDRLPGPPFRESTFTEDPVGPLVEPNAADEFASKLWFRAAAGPMIFARALPYLEAGSFYQNGDWSIGGDVTWAFGDLSTPDLSTRIQIYGLYARAGYDLVAGETWKLGGELSAGAMYQHMAATPTAFIGDAPERSAQTVALSARPAIFTKLAFSRIRLRVAAGLEVKTKTVDAALPSDFPNANAQLSTNYASPFVLFGVELRPF
jgi:hypothetical protein